MTQEKLEQLKATATEVRRGILTEVHAAKSGHPAARFRSRILLPTCTARCCGLTPKIPAGRTVTDWC